MTRTTRNWLALAAVSGLTLALASPGYADDRHPVERARVAPRGEVLDGRYNHGHYYPQRGAVVRTLPGGYRPYYYHGSRFYFSGGIWYAPGPYGFVVTGPPVGLYINALPPFYTTVWFGGVPYYYADNVYYRWAPANSGYEVVDAPAGADQPPGAPPAASASDFYIYPKNGQTKEQQSADQYECHDWSKNQTGFDPTEQGGGVPAPETGSRREQYKRAMTACLEARGYSVK